MVPRAIGVIFASVILTASLGGCMFAYDAAKPSVRYKNDTGEDVVVIVEATGSATEFKRTVPGREAFLSALSECEGTSIRVESASGEFLGRVESPACPDWQLTINADGSLDYVEQ